MADKNKRIIVVGGGPVGALNALFLGRRGFKVDLYEARDDIRKARNASGRSINLALSLRGLTALKHAGIDQDIAAIGTPMHSRYIHAKNGGEYIIPYGKKGQYLLSTDRLELNRQILTAAERNPNVTLHFEHKLVGCDTRNATATFKKSDGEMQTENGSLLMGCDGAHSAVRAQILKGRMDYSQMYIEHGYKELVIPPTPNGDFALPPNHLHIWPRHEFMLIALANLDKSFTCTLFMPFRNFDAIKTEDDVINFFREHFEDAIPLMGEKLLKESFFTLPALPLVTVKCRPYHYGNTAVLLGDAAHAMVPFYGQGLNSGLEDALLFDDLMVTLKNDFAKVLPAFSDLRVHAGQAIADLSMYNYMEMRSHVATPWFLLRKKVDGALNFLFPKSFIPRYSMVTFTRMSYDKIIKKAQKQDKIVDTSLMLIGGGLVFCGVVGLSVIASRKFERFNTPFDDILAKIKSIW